jgi:hypothetical protein
VFTWNPFWISECQWAGIDGQRKLRVQELAVDLGGIDSQSNWARGILASQYELARQSKEKKEVSTMSQRKHRRS